MENLSSYYRNCYGKRRGWISDSLSTENISVFCQRRRLRYAVTHRFSIPANCSRAAVCNFLKMTQNNVIEYNLQKLLASSASDALTLSALSSFYQPLPFVVIWSKIDPLFFTFTIISSLRWIIHCYKAVDIASKLWTSWEMHLHALLFRPAGKAS